MTADVAPTLDVLENRPEPALLWDAERLRVVWANPAALALWGEDTLFDLVERRFSATDRAVVRLGEAFAQLYDGLQTTVRLRFSGTSLRHPLAWHCFRHALNGGRTGLLVVAAEAVDEAREADTELTAQAFEALPAPVCVIEAGGRIAFCNAAARTLWTGTAPEHLSELTDDKALAAELLDEAGASGLASRVAQVVTRFGARPHRIDIQRMERAGADGVYYTVRLEDIADRRSLERGLRDHIDRLVDFVAAAATLTFELDGALRFASVDGDLPENLIGTAWTDFSSAHGLDPGGAIAMALASHDAWRMELPWPYKTGARATYVSAVPKFDHSGAFAGYSCVGAPVATDTVADAAVEAETDGDAADDTADAGPEASGKAHLSAEDEATFRNIGEALAAGASAADTPERRAAAEPGPSDEVLRTILDTATDGVLTLDREGRIASLNSSAQAIFGYDTKEAVGRPIYEFLTSDSAHTVRDYLSALSDSGLARIFNDGREIVAVEKQGGEIPLFVTIGRIYADAKRQGRVAEYCAVIRDITQWKRTEVELRSAKEQAERANAQKSEFLANISHELRTPLNAIIGFSEVMKTEKFGAIANERYRGYVTDIHASGEHLLSLINDLLDLSKVEAGKLELNFTSVDLTDIVQQCIGIIQEHATRERIIIRTSVADHLPNVVADQRSMRQILLNLLSNAVKFTEKGGQVIVSALLDEAGQVKLRVKDTGVGMTPEELVQAMEPFQRVSRPDTAEQPGTGLGLPLTKALAEANRARFEIESEPGRGTRVEITFPTTRVLAD